MLKAVAPSNQHGKESGKGSGKESSGDAAAATEAGKAFEPSQSISQSQPRAQTFLAAHARAQKRNERVRYPIHFSYQVT